MAPGLSGYDSNDAAPCSNGRCVFSTPDPGLWVLDGPAYFNRPGPRVVRGVEVLAHVLHGIAADVPVTRAEARRVRLA